MTKIAAVVGSKDRPTQVMLAAEALRKAAGAAGVEITVETHIGGAVQAPLSAETLAAAGRILAVGDVDAADPRFAGKTVTSLGLDAARQLAGRLREQARDAIAPLGEAGQRLAGLADLIVLRKS